MAYTYAVLGGGRQGTAAAYDMAVWGDAERVLIADISADAAQRSAGRVNDLIGVEIASPVQLDVTDRDALVAFLGPVDSFLSAVPYWNNPAITDAAIEARACMTDLGGKTDLVLEQLKRTAEAEAAGIAIVPDCGQVPGMGTSLSVYAMSLLDETDEIMMWDGGNPLHPRPPFNYTLTFNIAGLTNEYYGVAHFIRDGERTEVPTFLPEDYETVDFGEPIGRMEAFVAGGGTSTMPWTFEGKLKTLWNKTLRWPGHFAEWRAYTIAGLLEEEPIEVNGQSVVPRDVLHALLDPKDPSAAGRSRPGHRPGPGQGPQGWRARRGAGRAHRPHGRGHRLHGHGAHDRLGRLPQGHHERPGSHAPRRQSGRAGGVRPRLRRGAAQARLQPDRDSPGRLTLR